MGKISSNFLFFNLFKQVLLTKYAFTIFSHNEQSKKLITSTFETLYMQTSLAIYFNILKTKKHYLCNNNITVNMTPKFPCGICG